jgi:predicted metal-binding protein
MKRKTKKPVQKSKIPNSELCKVVKEKSNVRDVCIISPSDVETAAWVRLKCQFGCEGYGQCLVCPPYTPTPQQMREVLDSYKRAVLIHFTPEAHVKTTVAELEREFFLRGAWKAFALGAGSCDFCKTCKVDGGVRNRCLLHGEKGRPSHRGRQNNAAVPQLLRIDTD